MPGLIVSDSARAIEAAHLEITVEVLRTGWDSQTAVLREVRADVSYVRLPVDPHGLRLKSLFEEPRVVVVPAPHPLAGETAVSVLDLDLDLDLDLANEHLLQHPDAVPEWREIATESRHRRRTAPPRVSHTVEDSSSTSRLVPEFT